MLSNLKYNVNTNNNKENYSLYILWFQNNKSSYLLTLFLTKTDFSLLDDSIATFFHPKCLSSCLLILFIKKSVGTVA